MAKISAENIIYLAADHRGYQLKEQIKHFFTENKILFSDCGNKKYQVDDDYPDYAKLLAKKIQSSKFTAKGILLCGSAQGVCITANKFRGIRAAIVNSKAQVELAVKHNHVNVICLSADSLNLITIKKIIIFFLTVKPSKAQRHQRRISKIKRIESLNFK